MPFFKKEEESLTSGILFLLLCSDILRVMKNRLSLLLALSVFSVLFSSCSDMKEMKKAEEEDTLRSLSEQLSLQIPWTNQIEADRLTRNIKTSDGILKSIALTPVIVISGGAEVQESAVYPYLEGFGSLDVSDIPVPVKSVLDGFCSAVLKDTVADNYMSKKGLYSLALFYKDLPELEDKDETEAEPAPKEKQSAPSEDSLAAKDEKSADENAVEEVQENKRFSEWITGEPFVTASSFEIPVRFIAETYSCDVYLFFIKEESNWKIDQIQIHKWGEGNG